MTERTSSSKNSNQQKPAKADTPNQKYNKAEILNICNKTDKKCFEDMVKRFEDKKNQSSIKSISAASSSISNKSSCSTRHSFHTIQSPSAKKPMRNCKSLNFENSKQFSPSIYNSDGGSTSSSRTHHTKIIESKMKKTNNGHLSVAYKTEDVEKFDGAQSNCSHTNDDDNSIVDFDDGNYIQVNMTSIGECNSFDVNSTNLCYHDKLKGNMSAHENLEKGVREETRLTGVKILLRGDILGAINCLLPQLNLIRSVNLKHCKDVIVKAREYRKQIFEINKTKNLHVIQEHEYNIEKQEILKTLEDSICDVIDAKEIANAEKIFENYKIPSQTFNQSSTTASIDSGKRNKSVSKCSKTQTKHSQHHDAKKPQSAPSNLVEENVKNNNLKLQQKCKKSNLSNSHRDKRKQQAKKIIFTTFFKNSNLDKATDEKSVKNVWENSSSKFTKFTDSESSSVMTISEDEVHLDICIPGAKSPNDEMDKVVEELSDKKPDYELIKKIMRQLQDWCDEKRKSNVCSSSKNSTASKQLDQGKRTYSSVLKCSSSEKKTEKRKNSVKAKNKLTALSVNQKKENAKENRNYVSSAAAVASAPAVLENSNETQSEKLKNENPFSVQSSSSATSINHEQQTNNTTTTVADEQNNNNNHNNYNHFPIPKLLSDEDILLQLEKRIVHDLESILNESDENDERFLPMNDDDINTIPQTTATTLPLTNLKQYNQLIDQLNYTRLVQNMILPQFAAGYNAIANQYNYFWPMNNIMYSRNVIANYPQLFQHSIVINPITTTATTTSTVNDTTKLEATLNELNSLKRNCQNNQQTVNELRDVIMYQNKNFDSHSNFSNADEINTVVGAATAASKMISVSDLEKEALEQYKHSDDSLNKKFDVLEKEAEEQYDGYE